MPLRLVSAVALLCGLAAHAQATFEVASVKPAPQPLQPPLHRNSWGEGTGKVDLRHIQFQALLLRAFDVKAYQLIGPSWMTGEFYDISANAPAGATKEQIDQMFQALLADRFKLQAHRETQTSPVLALVVAKGGPKFEEVKEGEPPPAPDKGPLIQTGSDGARRMSGTIRGGPFGEVRLTSERGFNHNEFMKVTMKQFAEYLSMGLVGLPVIDRTELPGSYHLTLDVSYADMGIRATPAADSGAAPSAAEPAGGSVFESLQKLGLKLEAQKAPIEKLIVDHAEKVPTGN